MSFPFWIWACIFASSGLLALALEIVWFRVLAVTMKGTAFTFGTLLGVYLAGLGVGALAGSAVSTRLRHPAVVFLAVQAAIGAVAMFLLTAFIRFADNVPPLWAYLGSYEPLDIRTAVPALGRPRSVPRGRGGRSQFLWPGQPGDRVVELRGQGPG